MTTRRKLGAALVIGASFGSAALLGAVIAGLTVYGLFIVPLERRLDQVAVQQFGCEIVKDLFVPRRFKINRPQYIFKQPDPPIQ